MDALYRLHGQVMACEQTGLGNQASSYEQLRTAITRTHIPTAEHCICVRICASTLGQAFRMSGRQLTVLTISADIHDIGKLYVPASLLDKRERLTNADWDVIRKHPIWGAGIATAAFPIYPEVAKCVLSHHERMDGSGYPSGLSGAELSLEARIIAVADAFVALTEDRPFRHAYSQEKAFHILEVEERNKYDQEVVRMLKSTLGRQEALAA